VSPTPGRTTISHHGQARARDPEENVAELDEEQRGRVNETIDDRVAGCDVSGNEDESGEWKNENCAHQ
jgi:hypothetical protein